MPFEIVDQPERWIVGVVVRTSNRAERDPERARLGQLWGRAGRRATVAVLTDYERGRDGEYTQLVGSEVRSPDELAENQLAVRVPAGSFARFSCSGAGPEAIMAGWQDVWAAEDRADIVRSYRSDVELWAADGSPSILISVQ